MQGKLIQKALDEDHTIDPMNDTSRDPVPDFLKALELYPDRAEPYMALSYYSEWMRDHWCDRDVDPEVCKIMQQVAAYDYARIAVNKTEGGIPGGVSCNIHPSNAPCSADATQWKLKRSNAVTSAISLHSHL